MPTIKDDKPRQLLTPAVSGVGYDLPLRRFGSQERMGEAPRTAPGLRTKR